MFKCFMGVLAASAMFVSSQAYAGGRNVVAVNQCGQRVVVQRQFAPQRVVVQRQVAVNQFGQRVIVNRNFARDLRVERQLRFNAAINNQARINAIRLQNRQLFVQNRALARQDAFIRSRSIVGRVALGAAILGDRSVGRTLLGLSILNGGL